MSSMFPFGIYSTPVNQGPSPQEQAYAAEMQRRQKLIQKNALMQQQLRRQGGVLQPQQNHDADDHQAQPQQAPPDWQHPQAREHANALAAMAHATNSAWQREHDSRAQQASEERDRQHELDLANIKASAQLQQQSMQNEQAQQQDQARQQRNSALLQMAGFPTQRRNGQVISPLGRALMG